MAYIRVIYGLFEKRLPFHALIGALMSDGLADIYIFLYLIENIPMRYAILLAAGVTLFACNAQRTLLQRQDKQLRRRDELNLRG